MPQCCASSSLVILVCKLTRMLGEFQRPSTSVFFDALLNMEVFSFKVLGGRAIHFTGVYRIPGQKVLTPFPLQHSEDITTLLLFL
mmetsp:Transcript_16848/g.19275  ORF Transcript_16848/g.19275 Transcript_16848/m.19275 type:complete len:85 (-) Transcript_16848:668-922(-)